MKIPFCTFCVKSRMFCAKCQSLLDSGEYDELDVDVIDKLLSIEQKYKQYLSDVSYSKSYKVRNLLLIAMVGVRNMPRNIIKQIEDELTTALGITVKLVEHTTSVNDLATQLTYPARIYSISVAWLPDGTNETIIKIPKHETSRLPFKPTELGKVLSRLTNENVKVEVVG
ncbi:MAG: transcription elongation factor NusA [Thermocladium sp.]|nr:MAG: transcription elongation factor NusA [Thermocladium sp. ECH_B]